MTALPEDITAAIDRLEASVESMADDSEWPDAVPEYRLARAALESLIAALIAQIRDMQDTADDVASELAEMAAEMSDDDGERMQ